MPAKRVDKKSNKHALEVEEEEKPVEENGVYIFEAHENATYDGQVQRKPTDNIVRRHGQGTYTDAKHFTYTGDWKDDIPHSDSCVIKFASGATYEGCVVEGKFDGRGRYIWPDGKTQYVGQWRANRMHGEGTYTDSNGTVWSGRFYNGTGPGLRQSLTSNNNNAEDSNNNNNKNAGLEAHGNQLQ